MLAARPLPSICLSCRLRLLAAAHRRNGANAAQANSSWIGPFHRRLLHVKLPQKYLQRRNFSSAAPRRNEIDKSGAEPAADSAPPYAPRTHAEVEAVVRQARQAFGDTLPQGFLTQEELGLYERLYGPPLRITEESEDDMLVQEKVLLFRDGQDGELEEVAYLEEEPEAEDQREAGELGRFRSDVQARFQEPEGAVEEEVESRDWVQDKIHSEYEGAVRDDIIEDEEDFQDPEDAGSDYVRAHPLTVAGRFATSPSTLQLPRPSFVEPVTVLLADLANKHLAEVTQRIFGGPGLPHSPSTPRMRKPVEQKPITLDASQTQMSEREGDAYVAAVMPATHAAVMSSLVEVRKRLGSGWIRNLLQKLGGPRILDAGAGGAGVLAWREVLRAEWERMEEEQGSVGSKPAPLGKAYVVTGSDALRHRASRLLDNTTFLPRLPDYVVPTEQVGPQPRKLYDVVIAPHTLWPLREEYMRKQQVQTLWSLLNPSGGVLILIEKGLPRGFEVVAGARQLLLEKHIASPVSTEFEARLEDPTQTSRFVKKETGMIIAPCTNHETCPMYTTPGVSKGRKDFCHFNQRYIRPPYLQRILGAKDRNHEDVQFSYIAVQRGVDQRLPPSETEDHGQALVQGDAATAAAFAGHEHTYPGPDAASDSSTATPSPSPSQPSANTLSLPRTILSPLKRRGHVILDVCTPSGTLERWTVPRSFSKQAFRDARKARWGDLWGLGAKTRIARGVRLGRMEEGGVEGGKKNGRRSGEGRKEKRAKVKRGRRGGAEES